jgi:predicted protein tyrosine phosphatase
MIVVCPLNAVEMQIVRHSASHLISLLGPEHMIETPGSIVADRHLRLSLHDIAAPMAGYTEPRETHVAEMVRFIRTWDRAAPMVIHCWAGISRSTAAAFTAQCIFHPDRPERELAEELRAASPTATPNRLIVAAADRILERGGRMIEAVEAIGRGADAWEGVVFSLTMPPLKQAS